MIAHSDTFRRLLAAGLMLALVGCTTARMEEPEVPGVNPNEFGNTNDPAAGFANIVPGSEEDFILNVGRRIFFTQGSAALDSVAKTTIDGQIAFLNKYPRWYAKMQGFADDPGGDTVAVLGCGVDVAYPPEHGTLLEEIVARGGAVSEHPPGTQPRREAFPR